MSSDPSPTPATPRTAAGRRLLGLAYLAGDSASEGVNLAEAILAIEREAAAPAATELLRDVVQHWDAGDIDHDYDAITSSVDAAREYVRATVGLTGEHRHPSEPAP